MNSQDYSPLAVVTGASSGIGLELAKQFAIHGYDLVIVAEDEGIHRAAEELRDLGVSVAQYQIDLASYDGVETFYARFREEQRPVDAIALNAGIGVSGDFAQDTDLLDELKLIELNVTSVVHLAKRLIQDMLPRHQGRVLFTSSIAATMPGPFYAVYAASKAFIQSFALAIRDELKETGITVTALMPGATETNFFHRANMEDSLVGKAEKDDPAKVAEQGFEALMAGKDHVIAGSFANKIQGAAAKVLPQTLTAKMQGLQVKPRPDLAH